MKVRAQTAAALAVAGVAAQAPPPYVSSSSPVISVAPVPSSSPSASMSYMTVTYDQCESASIETMITVTNGVTVTYCPECEHPTTTHATAKPPGHTTIYTTTYLSLCPTGTVPVTYTVTESCEEETPTWTPGPSHVPQGFTVTVKECTVCDKTPIPVTITEPCDCEATSGTSMGPKPTATPIQQISDGQIQNPRPTPGSGVPSGGVATTAAGPKPTTPGAAAPYSTPAVTVKCPGPECRPKASGGATLPSGVSPYPPSHDTDGVHPAPYEGSAPTSARNVFVTLAVGFGVLAFAL